MTMGTAMLSSGGAGARFCVRCGSPVVPEASFCPACGTPLARPCDGGASASTTHVRRQGRRLPPTCALAYVPGLFWLPLAADPDGARHRFCANQGLWLTLLSIALGAASVAVGGWLLASGTVDLAWFDAFFAEWAPDDWAQRLPVAALLTALLPVYLFIPVASVCGVVRGVTSDVPYRVPLVGNLRLVGEPRRGRADADGTPGDAAARG